MAWGMVGLKAKVFLMHRVELKVMWYDDASKEPKLFLMHRVELKDWHTLRTLHALFSACS